jgi:hypothetical protein
VTFGNGKEIKMKMSKAIGMGSAIGGAASFGVLFLCGSPLSSDSLLPLAYVPTKICMWLSDVCFGGGEGGMIFILPVWLACGAVVGGATGSIVVWFSRL